LGPTRDRYPLVLCTSSQSQVWKRKDVIRQGLKIPLIPPSHQASGVFRSPQGVMTLPFPGYLCWDSTSEGSHFTGSEKDSVDESLKNPGFSLSTIMDSDRGRIVYKFHPKTQDALRMEWLQLVPLWVEPKITPHSFQPCVRLHHWTAKAYLFIACKVLGAFTLGALLTQIPCFPLPIREGRALIPAVRCSL
jgi:hypothetical protein